MSIIYVQISVFIFILSSISALILFFHRFFEISKLEKKKQSKIARRKFLLEAKNMEKIEKERLKSIKNNKIKINKNKKTKLVTKNDMIRIANIFDNIDTFLARKKYLDAEKCLIEVLSIDSDHIQANIELSNIYIYDGKFQKAETMVRYLLNIVGSDIRLLDILARSMYAQKKYELALKTYLEMHKLKRGDHDILARISDLYVSMNMPSDARKAIESAMDLDQMNVDYLWKYSEILKLMNDDISRYKTLKYLLEIQPYNEYAKQEIKKIKLS